MKIGIIGAGISGLTAAWLLQEDHEVYLFERNDHWGGHARSLVVNWQGAEVTVDPGAQNFSTQMYPCFIELLRILGVPTLPTPMRIAISWLTSPREVMLTPTGKLLELRHSLSPATLLAQLWLRTAIRRAAPIKSWDVTVQEFLTELKAPRPFVADILLPFLAMMLGTTIEKTYPASLRAAMVYPVLHQPPNPLKPFHMLAIPGGVQTYIHRLVSQLDPARTIKGVADLRVSRDTGKEPGSYRIRHGGGPDLTVDHLVVATSARDVESLLAELPGKQPLLDQLRKIEYINTELAVHSDVGYMPRDPRLWAEWNIQNHPAVSEFTMWAGRPQGAPVFKSWLFHESRRPYSQYQSFKFYHPSMTPSYYRVQKALREHQGKDNLWLAGSYHMHFDSHESAVRSALNLAKALSSRAQHLPRLAASMQRLSLD